MLFSVYFVLGQSIVIGPSDFEWLFLNSILGVVPGYSVMLFIIQSFVLGFFVFLFCCFWVRNAILRFLLLITISFLFLLLLSFTFLFHFTFLFVYVSVHLRFRSFTFLLHVSIAFSVWIHGRLIILVLFPSEEEAQLSLRFRL